MNMGKREIMFLLVLAMVPLAAWFFVFEPRNVDIDEARAEIYSMESTLTQLNELNRTVGDLGEAIGMAEISLAQFRENIPDAEQVDDLLSEIDDIGVRNSLDVKSVRTLSQIDTDGYSELPITLDIEGQFVGVYQFLADLENLPRITRVREFTISRDLISTLKKDDEPVSDVVTLRLVLVVYFEDRQDNGEYVAFEEMK